MNKVIAAVVFLVLFFPATYFVKVSPDGPVLLGYFLGALAFIIAPVIWKANKK